MIYAKIYLDTDEDGVDVLVFDSVIEDVPSYVIRAGAKKSSFGTHAYVVQHTRILGLENVAVSPEARELLRSIISSSNYDTSMFSGDLELSIRDGGSFGFKPTAIKKALNNVTDIPSDDNRQTSGRLRTDERFVFCTGHGSPHASCLEKMTEGDNDFLRALDISSPVDADILHKMYFEKKRAVEAEPPTDTETIRSTPEKYLTAAQRAVMRENYRKLLYSYDDREWIRNGKYIYSEIIIPCLMEKYNKSFSAIENILEIPEAERITK